MTRPHVVKALGLCITLAVLSPPSAARAVNAPKEATPRHYQRVMLLGGLSFVDDGRPALTVGGLYQVSLTTSTVTHGETCGGAGCITPPHLYAHLGASGGWSFEREDYAAFVQAGLMYRTGWTWVTAGGLVGEVAMPWRGVGPVLRAEIYDTLGLQVGYLAGFAGGDGGVFGSVDVLYGIFGDLLGN